MYKYEFEKINCNFGGWGLVHGNIYSTNEHQEIINKRAKEGWRYVGYIPTTQRGEGHIEEIDLIFEKKEEVK